MKKLFISSLLMTAVILAGCAAASTTPPTTQETTQTTQATQEKKGVTVYQINEDGSSQEVMKIGGDKIKTEDSTPTVLPGVKGIAVTKDGFMPSSLTIKVGTKVIFSNEGDEDHWPASDPHPVHSIEPGLDPLKALKPGETFEYTFNEAGTFGLHDHLFSGKRGKIIVTE